MTKPMEKCAKTVRDNSIGRMLTILTNRMKAEMKSRLAAIDLSLNEFFAMMNLANDEGQSQSDLAKKLSMPAYATSRLIDGLECKNLVERRDDPNSRRTHHLYFSQKGRELLPHVFETIEGVNEWVLDGLTEQEKQSFTTILSKLV